MANFLTVCRILLIIPFSALLLMDAEAYRYWAAGLFLLAAITDFLDGYVARKFDQMSALGAALDPVADKLLTAAALLLLIGTGAIAGVHILAALTILLREVLVTGLREAVAGLPKEEGKGLAVTQLAKWKTTVQFISLLLIIAGTTGDQIHQIGIWLFWLAALLTVITGYGYVTTAISRLRRA